MGKSQRPFNPDALRIHARQAIRAQLGPETLVRRYTVFVPLEEIKVGMLPRKIATDHDLKQLQLMLIRHFGGVTASTITPSLIGSGARDPRKPKKTQEINKHAFFVVYAAAVRASDDYFHALREELADALVEGVILVERQDVTIL
jgi:hypothetical protein